MKENDEEDMEAIYIEITKEKSDPDNYENAIDFRLSDVQEDEKQIA